MNYKLRGPVIDQVRTFFERHPTIDRAVCFGFAAPIGVLITVLPYGTDPKDVGLDRHYMVILEVERPRETAAKKDAN